MNKSYSSPTEEKNLQNLPSDAVKVLEVLSGIQVFTRDLAGHLVSELKPKQTMTEKVAKSRENNNNNNSRGNF